MVKVKVQQYLTKPNHCIWPIRTHYTFVSTNDYISYSLVQQPSTITILYMIIDFMNLSESGWWSSGSGRERSFSQNTWRPSTSGPDQSWRSSLRFLHQVDLAPRDPPWSSPPWCRGWPRFLLHNHHWVLVWISLIISDFLDIFFPEFSK